MHFLQVYKINVRGYFRTVELGISNFFADIKDGETTSIPSNTDNNDSISIVDKPIEPFNNDNDFANFQLGEFGVTQSLFVFHLTHWMHQHLEHAFFQSVIPQTDLFYTMNCVIHVPFAQLVMHCRQFHFSHNNNIDRKTFCTKDSTNFLLISFLSA